jgi:hypothetical protein
MSAWVGRKKTARVRKKAVKAPSDQIMKLSGDIDVYVVRLKA